MMVPVVLQHTGVSSLCQPPVLLYVLASDSVFSITQVYKWICRPDTLPPTHTFLPLLLLQTKVPPSPIQTLLYIYYLYNFIILFYVFILGLCIFLAPSTAYCILTCFYSVKLKLCLPPKGCL